MRRHLSPQTRSRAVLAPAAGASLPARMILSNIDNVAVAMSHFGEK